MTGAVPRGSPIHCPSDSTCQLCQGDLLFRSSFGGHSHWRRHAEAPREKTLDVFGVFSHVQVDGPRHFFQRDFPATPSLASPSFRTFFLWREMLLASNTADVGPIERGHGDEVYLKSRVPGLGWLCHASHSSKERRRRVSQRFVGERLPA